MADQQEQATRESLTTRARAALDRARAEQAAELAETERANEERDAAERAKFTDRARVYFRDTFGVDTEWTAAGGYFDGITATAEAEGIRLWTNSRILCVVIDCADPLHDPGDSDDESLQFRVGYNELTGGTNGTPGLVEFAQALERAEQARSDGKRCQSCLGRAERERWAAEDAAIAAEAKRQEAELDRGAPPEMPPTPRMRLLSALGEYVDELVDLKLEAGDR